MLYVVTTANDPKELFDQSRAPTPEFPRTRSFVPRNVYLSRSTDGGRTFDVRLAYLGPRENPHLGYNYAPVGAVDPDNPRNVYIGWTQGEWQSPKEPSKAVVSASSDGGRTFAPPHDISQLTGSEHPWLSVGRGGIVHAAHWSKGFGKPLAAPNLPVPTARQDPVPIFYASSRDKGKTWDRVEVDPGVQSYYRPPVIAADPNSDAVYMVWYSTVEPRNFPLTGQGADRTEIFLRASLDGGKTWGERRTVNDDAGKGANHSLPGVSLAPNGRVDIAWSDSRNNPRPPASPSRDQGLLDIYYASSEDQGRTFTPSQKINDRAIDRSLGVWSNNVNASVATGMASTDSEVYFTWQDARAGANEGESEDVYFATLKRDGSVLPANDEESVPGWLGIGAGLALGLGIGMVLVGVIARRNRPVTSGVS
ncbi:MAG: glycoside hydrolase [Actinomycetota bacterium]|nr:glycoside hydrolase [Actinomycetota bacterium]